MAMTTGTSPAPAPATGSAAMDSTSSTSTQIQTPSHNQSQIQAQTVHTYETILHRALLESNRIAKVDLSTPITENDVDMMRQIATAKMLNYCIRMLHADGWHPPTILRAMALRESGLERGIRGTMFQALRERRKELEMFKMRKAMSGGSGAATGDGGANTDQTMYPRQSSPRSSAGGSGSGKGNSNDNGNSDHLRGHGSGNGHGMRGTAMQGRLGPGHRHSHARNTAHTLPRHLAPVGIVPDTATHTVTGPPRTDPVIANGAVTRHTGMAVAGGEGRALELI